MIMATLINILHKYVMALEGNGDLTPNEKISLEDNMALLAVMAPVEIFMELSQNELDLLKGVLKEVVNRCTETELLDYFKNLYNKLYGEM